MPCLKTSDEIKLTMRKIVLFILFSLLLWGCEKKFDNVIDTTTYNYQVTGITFVGHQPFYDLKTPGDSLLEVRIIFSSESEFDKAYFDVVASDNSVLNSSPLELLPEGNNIFQNRFILKRTFPIGTYHLNFTVKGLDGKTKQVATTSFEFNNGQDNVPPVISNLVCPDSTARDISFVFSVTTVDSNGLNDVLSTFFTLYRPDGSVVEESPGDTIFAMHDDGDITVFGDSTANDGIYSYKNSFSSTAPTGNWRFIFQAIDRSNTLSNIIEHFLFVQ